MELIQVFNGLQDHQGQTWERVGQIPWLAFWIIIIPHQARCLILAALLWLVVWRKLRNLQHMSLPSNQAAKSYRVFFIRLD